jgi:hypothetical protein
MRYSLIVGLSIGLGGPALSEDVSVRPESCERLATIQYDDCEVENLFRCARREGEYFRSEYADAYEIYSIQIEDPVSSTVDLHFLYQSGGTNLAYSGGTPADAIATGRSEQKITGFLSLFGMRRPISGESTYIYEGQTEEIGGLTYHLLISKDRAVLPPPMGEAQGSSVYLLNKEADLFIQKESNFSLLPGKVKTTRMVELSRPGQPGFTDEVARYGCGDISRLEAQSYGDKA